MVEGVSLELLSCGGNKKSTVADMGHGEGLLIGQGFSEMASADVIFKGSIAGECSTRNAGSIVNSTIGAACSSRHNMHQSAASLLNRGTVVRRIEFGEYETGSDVREAVTAELGRPLVVEQTVGNDQIDCVVPELNAGLGSQFNSTNVTNIISLVDAATLSWSNTSEEISNWEDSDKDEFEDMRMLKAVEELERVEQAKQKLRGKRKIFDSGDDTSYTNGLSMATPESDDEWEYEGWSHLMANDIVPVRRDDVPAQPLTLENEIGGPSSAPKDISEAVLAYHRDNVATPDADENIYEDNDSLLGLSDAEPVFDDVYNLTFVDGAAPASSEKDAIYIGRIFKDKNHMQTTLAIYAIKRLFHFKQTRSDPGRLIFHCVDRKCSWRVYAVSAGQESKNFEVRTLTLTHTCNIA